MGKMSNIGKDVNLYTPRQIRMSERTLEMFHRHFDRSKNTGIWFDVGAEDSYTRDVLRPYARNMVTTNIDLDVDCLPWYDGIIQTVTSFEVLEHLYNPLFHLRELYRVMKPAATMYLTTPNDYSLIYKAEHLLSRKYTPHFHQFSERDLRNIMDEAGFKIRLLKKFRRGGSGTIARISRNGLFAIITK